eukprot:EC722851.1.p1 GENE.EC722851.1~~EC722851.1.p1  ORF type:complete len:145 (+),score=10.00 EC722851.1:33-467(+)
MSAQDVVYVPDDERLITDEAVIFKNADELYTHGITDFHVTFALIGLLIFGLLIVGILLAWRKYGATLRVLSQSTSRPPRAVSIMSVAVDDVGPSDEQDEDNAPSPPGTPTMAHRLRPARRNFVMTPASSALYASLENASHRQLQ